MDLKKMLNSVPRVIHGQAGRYFEVGEGTLDEQPVEIYIKPAFKDGPYILDDGNVMNIKWLEVNLLLMGLENHTKPSFEGPWTPLRPGWYKDLNGKKHYGVLVAKIMVPMGTFNGNMQTQSEWAMAHCGDIEERIVDDFLPKIKGKITHHFQQIFELLHEGLNEEPMILADTKTMVSSEFLEYIGKADKKIGSKFTKEKGGHDEDDDNDDD